MTAAKGRQRRTYAARMPVEQRRQQLLDAALALIARDGYGALTIEAIAREAGVTKPVVYGAYANLSVLLGALMDRTQSETVAQIVETFPADMRDSPDIAAEIARGWAHAVRSRPLTWTPVLLAGPSTPTEVLVRVEQGREVIRATLQGFLSSGRPVDPETAARHHWTAHVVLASAEHFGRLILTDPESISDDEIAALFRVLIAGLLRRPPGENP